MSHNLLDIMMSVAGGEYDGLPNASSINPCRAKGNAGKQKQEYQARDPRQRSAQRSRIPWI